MNQQKTTLARGKWPNNIKQKSVSRPQQGKGFGMMQHEAEDALEAIAGKYS